MTDNQRYFESQPDRTQNIVVEILRELERAAGKHPQWPTDPLHAVAIVGEESGELTRAVLNKVYEGGSNSDVHKEAIHTAATCIRFIGGLLGQHYKAARKLK